MNELRDRMEAITAEAKTRTENLMACIGQTTYESIKPEVKTPKDDKTCVMENVEGGKAASCCVYCERCSSIRPNDIVLSSIRNRVGCRPSDKRNGSDLGIEGTV